MLQGLDHSTIGLLGPLALGRLPGWHYESFGWKIQTFTNTIPGSLIIYVLHLCRLYLTVSISRNFKGYLLLICKKKSIYFSTWIVATGSQGVTPRQGTVPLKQETPTHWKMANVTPSTTEPPVNTAKVSVRKLILIQILGLSFSLNVVLFFIINLLYVFTIMSFFVLIEVDFFTQKQRRAKYSNNLDILISFEWVAYQKMISPLVIWAQSASSSYI